MKKFMILWLVWGIVVGYGVTLLADNNSTPYYDMKPECEIFNPVTGVSLDDSNTSKCRTIYPKPKEF